jgi:hypothetical protein
MTEEEFKEVLKREIEVNNKLINEKQVKFNNNNCPSCNCIKMFENEMNLVKTNNLVYLALIADKPDKAIFPLLLAKYDDLLTEFYDILSDMVRKGSINESYYLDYCKDSLENRESIKKLCECGSIKKLCEWCAGVLGNK